MWRKKRNGSPASLSPGAPRLLACRHPRFQEIAPLPKNLGLRAKFARQLKNQSKSEAPKVRPFSGHTITKSLPRHRNFGHQAASGFSENCCASDSLSLRIAHLFTSSCANGSRTRSLPARPPQRWRQRTPDTRCAQRHGSRSARTGSFEVGREISKDIFC